ncbi:MAG: DNA polymerase/3'-5' exonuclease PolX [Phycisphaerae bacterium]
MKNHEIANIFNQMADLLELSGENVFRVNSYRNAARIIDELPQDVAELDKGGKLAEISGIGERSVQKIEEYIRTGKIGAYEELIKKIPPKLPELLKIPGMGPKTVALAWKELGVEDIESLRKAITGGHLAKLSGMGARKIENIQKGLDFLAKNAGRNTLGIALPRTCELVDALKTISGITRVEVAGSLRRWAETVGDLDILVESSDGEKALKKFSEFEQVREVLALGDTKASVRIVDEIQVDVRVVPKESFGAAWMYFTGSKSHNIRLREVAIKNKWKLNEYGLFSGDKSIGGETEESIYKKLGLPWIPPELREDRGEIEHAHDLPKLLELSDIKGDLHIHTMASDGRSTIEEMVEACIARGYKYICITDHSPSERIANGLDEKRLLEHIKQVRKTREKSKKDIIVLAGSEVDILADGSLDYKDEILKELDFVIGSVHSGLGNPEEKMTSRILKAMDNPHVRMIGHLTGRLIGEREPSNVDVSKVIKHAAETNTWLELNASWRRLDLKDVHCREAKEQGVKIVICTDSHDISQLDQMRFGVYTARRGWIEAKDVVNTLAAEKFVSLLEKGKK